MKDKKIEPINTTFEHLTKTLMSGNPKPKKKAKFVKVAKYLQGKKLNKKNQ